MAQKSDLPGFKVGGQWRFKRADIDQWIEDQKHSARQGESNIRRWVIENDWLEAIIALPLNMFYNTGIATCIWVLSNQKPEHRQGKVQLVDATKWFKPLRKNLGSKNCELSEADIQRITDAFLAFEETAESKIFDNRDFGYWKVTVERPLRLRVDLSKAARTRFQVACTDEGDDDLARLVEGAAKTLGVGPHDDYNAFLGELHDLAKRWDVKLSTKRLKSIQSGLATRCEDAAPVIRKEHKAGKAEADPLRGLFAVKGKKVVVEYEPDPELRDTEQVPLNEPGGIPEFLKGEVLPHAPDAWFDEGSVRIGYEISFTRYFYKPVPLRSLDEIRADIVALERETEGLLAEIVGGAG